MSATWKTNVSVVSIFLFDWWLLLFLEPYSSSNKPLPHDNNLVCRHYEIAPPWLGPFWRKTRSFEQREAEKPSFLQLQVIISGASCIRNYLLWGSQSHFWKKTKPNTLQNSCHCKGSYVAASWLGLLPEMWKMCIGCESVEVGKMGLYPQLWTQADVSGCFGSPEKEQWLIT